MNISRFFGATNREALRQVRLALGSDALIVSNRRVNGGVEILAADPTSLPISEEGDTGLPGTGASGGASTPPAPSALDPASGAPVPAVPKAPQATTRAVGAPPAVAPKAPAPQISPMSPLGAYAAAFQAAYGTRDVAEAPTAAATPQSAPPPVPAAPPSASAPGGDIFSAPDQHASDTTHEPGGQPGIMDAIGAMRGALENRIDELLWGNQLRQAPQAASLFQALLGFGFSTALLRAMLKRLPQNLSGRAALQWARQELISHLPVPATEDALWQPGLALALVGPTGVGKTTTIAKLAARCVRRFGPDKLVLITTDTYRIGAHEQLKIYGEMLRVPVHVVRDADGLRDIMRGIRPDQIVLIDNVGISQRNRYVSEQAAMLAAAGRDVTRLLVLNAASHGETLDEVARNYTADGGTPLKGCIITKVDEASRLGAALDTALRYRLPVHYVSIGQKVPEHLAYLSASELVDQALTHQPSARTLYAPTEADFAALMAVNRPKQSDADTAATVRQQQMQALPRLLSMAGNAATQLTYDDLRMGCDFIDELTCASEAFGMWRTYASGIGVGGKKPEAHDLASMLRQMVRLAQNEWAESGHKHLLAVHDHVALRANGAAPAHLRATMVFTPQGIPLSTTHQQLAMQAGWLSSCGAVQAQPPTPRDALLLQLKALAEAAPELPVVHLLEGGNPALWRGLSEQPLKWLAQVPAITRVHMDDGATTVQALAKTLAHHPVADPDYLFGMAEVAGAPAAEHALWVAATPVSIASRGTAALSLQMISARLINREDGKVVKSVLGLHPAMDVSVEKLAAWLVLKAESREAMRHTATAWSVLPSDDAHSALQHKVLVSTQLGMAAWQLRKSPLAAHGRNVATTMLGKKALAPASAASGLLKLFALKEITST